MSAYGGVSINGPATTFGDIQTAQRFSVIELKSNYGVSNLRDITTTNNSATVTSSNGEYNLSTGATTGSTATLDSAERGRYLPGAMAQCGIAVRIDETFTGTSEARWGYFDGEDGFGFGVDATGIFVFTRRSSTDTDVYQSAWNADHLDGSADASNPSGLTLSLAEGNIFQFDFSWYGYGTIEFKVVLADSNNVQETVTVHRFSPSQQTSVIDPNLPIRATVTNGGTTTDYDVFVAGRQFSVFQPYEPSRRVNGERRLALGSIDTTFLPLVTFRRKSAFDSVSVKVNGFDIITDAALVWQLRVNGSLTSASYATPSDTTASETACEADSSATAISGGEILDTGLIAASGTGMNTSGQLSRDALSFDVPALQPVTLCVRRVTGTGATVSSVLKWREEW